MIHTLLFRSGAKIYFEAEDLSVTFSKSTGQTRGIKWTNPKNTPLHIDVTEVVAVFVGKV